MKLFLGILCLLLVGITSIGKIIYFNILTNYWVKSDLLTAVVFLECSCAEQGGICQLDGFDCPKGYQPDKTLSCLSSSKLCCIRGIKS